MLQNLYLAGILIAVVGLPGCTATDEQVIVSFAPVSVATGTVQAVDGLSPLHMAVRDGETAVVKRLLDQGENVNAASSVNGATPLIQAATNGHDQIVAALLDAGAAVNTTDRLDATALMYASSNGYIAIVNNLLRRGADVNIQSPSEHLDSTALTLAAGNGHDAVLKLLLKAGADIDWQTARDGYSALMLAAEFGHWSSVNTLLSAGANPALVDRKGDMACALATANGHAAVTKVLDEYSLSHGEGRRCVSGAN